MKAIMRFLIVLSCLVAAQGLAEESSTNRVLRLDGRTGYMDVADSASLHTLSNAVTLELRFRAASFYENNGAVNSLLRKNVTAGAENFFLRFRIINRKPIVEFTPGIEIGIVRAPFDFKPGTWYHLAATFDGTNISVFVDGAAIKTDELTGSIRIDDSDLVIGRGDPEYSSGEYFDGALDEIRIWAVARSPGEIQASMNTRMTGKERGLVAYWNFDDGTATDQSGHGNRGVLKKQAEIVESARVAGTTPEK